MFEIRPLKEVDGKDVRELMLQNSGSHTFVIYKTEEVPSSEQIAKKIRRFFSNSRLGVLLGAYESGVLIGYLFLERGGLSHTEGVGTISLCVSRNHQRRGAGRQLITSSLKWAREESLYRLQMTVQTNNEVAIRLYASEGFVLEGFLRKAGKTEDRFVDKYQMAHLL